MSATRASWVHPLGSATLDRSPKDLAKPYLDRKYRSVQARQYLLGGQAGDPGQWSLNRAQAPVPGAPEAADATEAVGTKVMDEALEDVSVLEEKTVAVCGG